MDLVEEVFNQTTPSVCNTTTAERVVLALAKRGITRDAIMPKHLEFVYQMLQQRPNHPDFTFIDQLPLAGSSATIDEDALWGVIVETRPHPALEFAVTNFATLSKAPIQLFHGPNAREFILSTSIRKLISSGQVTLTSLGVDRLGFRDYNALLLSQLFWNTVHATEKVIIFQTDSILCSRSKYPIDNFMDYDYIGSRWKRARPTGLVMDGGNGGLSLRDKQKTLACLKRFPPESWRGGEDGYFAFHLDVMGANIGRGDACAKFSTQNEFLFPSLGAHNISRLSEDHLRSFLEYCPEARNILG